jgi:hypothetical protein
VPSRAVTSRASRRIPSPRLFPGNSYKHLDDARVGKGHVTTSAVTSRVSAVTQQLKRFPRVRSRVYRRDWSSFTSQCSIADNRGWFVVGDDLIVWIEDLRCEWKTFFVCSIWSVWFNETVIIPVLRSVAGKRLVETGSACACATVCCKWCKSAIALYCCIECN